MKNKIKYLNFDYNREHSELSDDFDIVKNPTEFNNLPDGEYLIRGDKKNHSKEYWVKDNIWYLVSVTTIDNGHYYCNAGTYQLFPNLPEKEWDLLNKVVTKLSPYWKRAVYGRNQFMSIRELRRDIKKSFLKRKF
jgi:hypothetical protein